MITLRNLTLRRGDKVVLQGANLTLQPGEKVGLIGRNGAGKSSLFALLTDKLHADAGDVEIPPRWQIGEVAQAMPETEDGATDFVLQGDLPLQQRAGRAGRGRGQRRRPCHGRCAHGAGRSRRLRRQCRARRRCCSAWASASSSSTRR
jgi:ATPase subunit of ABC transporter with duplicated ATPase domains